MTEMPFEADPRAIWRTQMWGSPLQLDEVPTNDRLQFSGRKSRGRRLLAERAEALADSQELLWAHHAAAAPDARAEVMDTITARVPSAEHADRARHDELLDVVIEDLDALERGPRVLLVLQGMDASGKGGMVKHVVGSMDPLGVSVAAFRRPTADERSEHHLHRVIRRLPGPGEVGVFDRSHYEDVLVPAVAGSADSEELARRTETLRLFEQGLVRRGFVLVKVFLHLSEQEQLERLLSRLDRRDKQWKYDPSDADARAAFGLYRTVYSGLLEATDVDSAPWHVVGADRKWYARLVVQELLIAALDDLDLSWPQPGYDLPAERARLLASGD